MKIFSILILFITNIYSQIDYFYISYRSVLHNNILRVEKFHISRVMVTPTDLTPYKSFQIFTEKEFDIDVPKFFKKNQDLITKELFTRGVFITDRGEFKKRSQNNKSVLTLPPTIVSVSVKDNFVNITLYKY